jgi:hypothetical protein
VKYIHSKEMRRSSKQFETTKYHLGKTDQLDKEEIELIINVLKAEADNFIADGKVDKAFSRAQANLR